MTDQNSLLDKILQNKQAQDVFHFHPHDTIEEFFKHLTNKEKEILSKRYGLYGNKPHTLEQIGKNHQITRERIRQIQNVAISKIKQNEVLKNKLNQLNQTITRIIQDYGGLMEESHFISETLSYSEKNDLNKMAIIFLVSEIINENIEEVSSTEHFLPGWKLKIISLDFVKQVLAKFVDIIEQENNVLDTDLILSKFKQHDFYKNNLDQFIPFGLSTEVSDINNETIDKILLSYLKISYQVEQNILGKWGLRHWPNISPKRMGDKIYLILTKVGRPLHFTEIAKEINTAIFDKKIAYPPTIHNELILDERYVLVGRGIYALKEWGYENGTVSDVISDILSKANKPLTKQEIVDSVLKSRIVKKSTIHLALSNKNKFQKVNNTYILKQ